MRVYDRITSNPNFKEIFDMVMSMCEEPPMLVGGKLYRTIIEELHGYPAQAECCDYDFVTEKTRSKKKQSGGWRFIFKTEYSKGKKNTEGSVHLKKKNLNVDIMDLRFLTTTSRDPQKYPPTLDGYFKSVPLNIQAIALDPFSGRLYGDIGIKSIAEELVTVNCEDELEEYIEFKKILASKYILDKAASIRFAATIPAQFNIDPNKGKKTLFGGWTTPMFAQIQSIPPPQVQWSNAYVTTYISDSSSSNVAGETVQF